jgi:colicin import membrane protein
MSARAMDPLRPRRPGGMGRGAAIAIGVHVLLLIALAVGVNWRASEPQNVTAELWAAVPETAAPAPAVPAPPKPVEKVVEPPPQPVKPEPPPAREADIALEKENEKQRLKALADEEKEKAEAQKKKKELAAQQKQAQAERQAQAEAAQREANLKRIQGMAGATGAPTATGMGQRDAGPKGPSAGYGDRIRSRVKPNIVMTEAVTGSPRAEVEVRAAPDGTILSRRLVKSSGDKAWDDAVLRAIDRTAVLPRDADGTVPSPITIGFTP